MWSRKSGERDAVRNGFPCLKVETSTPRTWGTNLGGRLRCGSPTNQAIGRRVLWAEEYYDGRSLPLKARGEACKGTEPMLPPQKTRDLARSLVACEAEASTTSLQTEPAIVRAYERLRRQLGASVGVDGFQALASRALALAKSESPRLSAVKVTANGVLHGLGEVESQPGTDEDGEVGINLIAQLLGLFLTFLGEATTMRLIHLVAPQAVSPSARERIPEPSVPLPSLVTPT